MSIRGGPGVLKQKKQDETKNKLKQIYKGGIFAALCALARIPGGFANPRLGGLGGNPAKLFFGLNWLFIDLTGFLLFQHVFCSLNSISGGFNSPRWGSWCAETKKSKMKQKKIRNKFTKGDFRSFVCAYQNSQWIQQSMVGGSRAAKLFLGLNWHFIDLTGFLLFQHVFCSLNSISGGFNQSPVGVLGC